MADQSMTKRRNASRRTKAIPPRKAGKLQTDPVRSRLMASIKGRGNRTTELRFIRILREYGLTGWRRHMPLPGTPDFAFPSARVAIFVNGCFWHACPRCYREPRVNTEFWRQKTSYNRARDKSIRNWLRRYGWSVITVWEHELSREDLVAHRVRRSLLRSSPAPVR